MLVHSDFLLHPHEIIPSVEFLTDGLQHAAYSSLTSLIIKSLIKSLNLSTVEITIIDLFALITNGLISPEPLERTGHFTTI